MVDEAIDIPIISTVTSIHTPIDEKLAAGVDMINISAGKDTAATVRYFRGKYPELPIIATGGPTESSIHETIIAGANAITYTPLVTVNYSAKMKNIVNKKKQPMKNKNALAVYPAKAFWLFNVRFYGTMEE